MFFIRIFNSILVLQFKAKLDVYFKNYPFILKFITYFSTASYVNILIETVFFNYFNDCYFYIFTGSIYAIYNNIEW
jgi:hypothetical protein